MMRPRLIATAALVGLIGGAGAGCKCSKKEPPPAQPAAQTAAYPTIVHIVSRHQTITIKSSPQGPRYSVRTDEGKILLADATAAEFESADPKLYQQMRHS